jgi:hypothetical protein
MEISSTLQNLLRAWAGLGTGATLMLLSRSRTEGYAGIYGINKLHKLIIQNEYWRKVKFYDRVPAMCNYLPLFSLLFLFCSEVSTT